MELRPLDLAGMLSRAATMYARDFGRFVAVVATAIVPVAVMQYFVTVREQPQLDATIAWLQQSPSYQLQHAPSVLTSPQTLLLALATSIVGYLLLAFAIAGVGAGVAAENAGVPMRYRASFRVALGHWRTVTGVVGLLFVLTVVAGTAAIGAVLIPLSAITAIISGSVVYTISLGVLAILTAISLLLTMIVVVGASAIYAAALEDCAPVEAVARALRRICNRQEFGRSLVCASMVSAIVIVVTSFADLIAFALLQHRPVLYLMLDAVARALVVPFAAIVLAVYYFDLRVRREGFDLRLRIDRLNDVLRGESEYAPTRYLSGEERALQAAFLERRSTLDPPCRRDLASRLVGPVRERLPEELARMDDEALLERL
jgi:hypothetical protein